MKSQKPTPTQTHRLPSPPLKPEISAKKSATTYQVLDSGIHGSGIFAGRDLKRGERIMEYIGERINKTESEKRANAQMAKAKETGEAGVYIFALSKRWDLDGGTPDNDARLINHSCEPNCEARQEGYRIFIHAIKRIPAGTELSFDYGFPLENWEEHPCRCGTKSCVGHIVWKGYWNKLRKIKEAALQKSASEVRKPSVKRKTIRSR